MIAFRALLLFGFLVLLDGCATATCPYPSYPSYTGENCLYKLEVTKIDTTTGWVRGRYPDDLIKKGEAENPKEDFKFLVRNLDWWVSKHLLQEKKVYFFVNNNGSPFLEPFPEGYTIESPYYLWWVGK